MQTRSSSSNQTGSVAVVVALLLTVLLAVMAFSMDTGYLYLKKNQYQNAVEAAAMAGAWNLCNNPEDVARQIAGENGIPNDEEFLTVLQGYYDEGDSYDDFSVYKDFAAEGSGEYPSDKFNNAVMVSLKLAVSPISGNLLKSSETTISASSVAVARCAGLLSFGDDSSTSGILINNWQNSSSIEFQDMGLIHSNTNVEFRNSPLASVDGDTRLSAAGSISSCPSGGCIVGGNSIYPSTDLDTIMEEMRETADSVIVLTDDNFPVYDLHTSTGGRYDQDGNLFYRSTGLYVFCPYDGDHGGAVYYFENQGSDTYLAIKGRNSTDHARNLTVASENSLAFTSSAGNYLTLGGEEEEMVYFYTKEDVGGGMGGAYGALNHDFQGVAFRAGGDFWVRPDSQTYKLRVIAEEQIHILSYGAYETRQTVFDANFGPPCPPLKVALRQLERTED